MPRPSRYDDDEIAAALLEEQDRYDSRLLDELYDASEIEINGERQTTISRFTAELEPGRTDPNGELPGYLAGRRIRKSRRKTR